VGDNAAVGALSEDLQQAALRAQRLSPQACRLFAMNFSWEACTRQFLINLATPEERQSAR
jgi:hypothetical protein